MGCCEPSGQRNANEAKLFEKNWYSVHTIHIVGAVSIGSLKWKPYGDNKSLGMIAFQYFAERNATTIWLVLLLANGIASHRIALPFRRRRRLISCNSAGDRVETFCVHQGWADLVDIIFTRKQNIFIVFLVLYLVDT